MNVTGSQLKFRLTANIRIVFRDWRNVRQLLVFSWSEETALFVVLAELILDDMIISLNSSLTQPGLSSCVLGEIVSCTM